MPQPYSSLVVSMACPGLSWDNFQITEEKFEWNVVQPYWHKVGVFALLENGGCLKHVQQQIYPPVVIYVRLFFYKKCTQIVL